MRSRTIRLIPVSARSWRSGLGAFQSMPAVFIPLSIAVAVITYVQARMLSSLALPHLAMTAFAMVALDLLCAVILSLMVIAVQRFILLGETADGSSLFSNGRRTVRIVSILALITLLSDLAVIQIAIEYHFGLEPGLPITAFPAVGRILGPVLAISVLLVCSCLVPAISVDAPGASLNNAMNDTWFDLWRIFLLVLLVALPVVTVQSLLWIAFINGAFDGQRPAAFVLIKSISRVVLACVLAAASAYVYRCYADLLDRPRSQTH